MPYQIYYHPEIQGDISKLPNNIKTRIKKAIEGRLNVDPLHYGDPLKRSLQGFRKLRVGDYRVIYRIDGQKIIILKIGHRKEIYEQDLNRGF